MRIRLFKRKTKNIYDETTQIMPTSRVSRDSVVGRYCYIGERCDITRARIGNYVSIANNVSVGPGEHHVRDISTSSLFYEKPYAELTRDDCTIESDAWIGVDSVIRRGVRIGIGAVVGANSFVNSDVPDFGIVAGSPARLIGYRFSEEQRAKITQSRWWEMELAEARLIIETLKKEIA
ncbi:transferase family hexapeptide repeat protein [Rhizobium sullae]|uniref:Transferase family hexapeptide repeat protein n=1 Tax=Rhizobium sullae TaxID=50338 RepID=A0A4R3PZ59_RHISU|nr:transferase family hexapeptide repeat protein [Rhizobium sullae]